MLHYSFTLIHKNRRRVKLQSLQFYINSKTIKLQRVKTVCNNFRGDGTDKNPVQVPIERPQTVFPTRGQQVGDITNFVREEPQGLRCFDQDLGHLCRGRRVQKYGHSDFEKFCSVSQSYLGVSRYYVGWLSSAFW